MTWRGIVAHILVGAGEAFAGIAEGLNEDEDDKDPTQLEIPFRCTCEEPQAPRVLRCSNCQGAIGVGQE